MFMLLCSALLQAQERVVVICQTGSVTSPEEAQPYIDGFGKYLAEKAGWAAGSYRIQFENSREGGLKALDDVKVAYGTLSLGIFLQGEAKYRFKPLVLARVGGKTSTRYRVLVKKGTYKTLDDLKGKALTGNLVDDPVYLSKVVFAGKYTAAQHFALKQTPRALRALRNVSKGKADAALVDDLQFSSLKQLPLFDKLEVIFESEEVPNLGLVFLDGRTSEADARKLAQALIGMCSDPVGKTMCKDFNVEGFEAVPPNALERVKALYGK
jgi:ABC-type amino acid transport substrate-binding protein